ncbi:MAG: Ig-like domain-containing protein, partial [Actinomycetota bacterium]
MRARILFVGAMLVAGLGAGAARATHFDNDPATGSFNPQLSVTITQTLVNRPTGMSLRLTQADHEDPPVVSRLRSPGGWQWAFSATRRAEKPNPPGGFTSECDDAIDNDHNSPNGTGTGGNLDFSKRTDAFIARAEKVGTLHLKIHADGVTRPGAPATWDGTIGFLSYNPATQTGVLCALFISTDQRVISLPDTDPTGGGDDIEGVTEIAAEFPVARVTVGAQTWWETLVDLEDLATDSTFQQLNVSLIELSATFSAHSVGNWHAGGIDFSKAPLVSGLHNFQGTFRTCPAADPAYGNCRSGRPDVIRTIPFTFTLPAPVITAPPDGALLNTNPVPISGTSDPSATIQVFEAGSPVGPVATANGAGAWTALVPMADGVHTVGARTVDAGGQSPLSNTRTFTLDTTPPLPPVILVPPEGALLAGTNVTISGTAEIGALVTVVEGPITIGSVNVAPSGTWTLSTTMTKGAHAIAARATDIAGNVGLNSPLRTFNVTTAIPAIVTPPEDAATNQGNVVISGISEANASILVEENGIAVGPPVLATGTGSWAMTVAFPEGTHGIIATATEGGFVSPPSPLRTFAVDFTPPLQPTIDEPLDGSTVRSILVHFAGGTESRASIGVFEGPQRIGSATADLNGNWSTDITMVDGSHTVRAVATDRAGNVGPSSPTITFLVEDPLAILLPLPGSQNGGSVRITGTADQLATGVR